MRKTFPFSLALALFAWNVRLFAQSEPDSPNGAYSVYASNNLFYARAENASEIASTNTDAAALLNHLARLRGCRAITFLPGDYPMKKLLRLKSGLSLSGQPGARLLQRHGGDLIAGPGVVNCQIANLELVGQREKFSGIAINFSDRSQSNSLSGLYIHDFGGDGIAFNGTNTLYNVVRSNHIENCVGAGIGHYWTAGDALITDNFIFRTRFHGIIVSRGGSRCRIASNTVVEAGYYLKEKTDFSHGIAVDGFAVVHGTGNVIIGNVVSNAAMAGIEVADFQDNCAVLQNRIFGTGHNHYGIYFGGGLSPSTNALITSNLVQNADGSGIHIDSPMSGEKGVTSGVTISGNVIRDSNDHGIFIGVAANVTVTGNVCVDNARRGFGNGIAVHGRGAPSRGITLTGNRCFDDRIPPIQGFGVMLENVSGIRVSGNVLKSNKNGPIGEIGVTKAVITDNSQ